MAKPENSNFLQPTKFMLTFPKIADTTFFCQTVNIPGLKAAEATRQIPNMDLYTPGTRLSYGTLNFNFLVNENITSWKVIHDWMRDNTIDHKFNYKNVDALLTILTNQNNPKIRIKYSNVFPISLSDLPFDTTLSADNHISCDAVFRFDFYDIELL